jgi:hypothetical protein
VVVGAVDNEGFKDGWLDGSTDGLDEGLVEVVGATDTDGCEY